MMRDREKKNTWVQLVVDEIVAPRRPTIKLINSCKLFMLCFDEMYYNKKLCLPDKSKNLYIFC